MITDSCIYSAFLQLTLLSVIYPATFFVVQWGRSSCSA